MVKKCGAMNKLLQGTEFSPKRDCDQKSSRREGRGQRSGKKSREYGENRFRLDASSLSKEGSQILGCSKLFFSNKNLDKCEVILERLEQAKPAHGPKKLQSSTNFTKPKQHSPEDQIYHSNPDPPTTQVFCKNPIEFQSNSPPSKPEDFDSEEVDHKLMNALLEIKNNSLANISHPEITLENPQQPEQSKTKTIKGLKKKLPPPRLRSNLSQDSFGTVQTIQTIKSSELQKVRKISNATGQFSPNDPGQFSPKNLTPPQHSTREISSEKKCCKMREKMGQKMGQKTQNPLFDSKNRLLNYENPLFDSKNPHLNDENPLFDSKNPHLNDENPFFHSKNRLLNDENQLLDSKNRHSNDENQLLDSKSRLLNDENPLFNPKNQLFNDSCPESDSFTFNWIDKLADEMKTHNRFCSIDLQEHKKTMFVLSENSDLIKNFRLVNSLKGLAKEFGIGAGGVCDNLIEEHRDWGWEEQKGSLGVLEVK
jgi:hypothetical protein